MPRSKSGTGVHLHQYSCGQFYIRSRGSSLHSPVFCSVSFLPGEIYCTTTPERYVFFPTPYDINTIFGFFSQYDTISLRYFGLKKDLLFKEFLANFQIFRNFWRFFGIFCVFSEFSGNFLNFRRIFDEKRQQNHWY